MSLTVQFNKSFSTEEAIKKYLGSTHGLTLIALSLADIKNKELRIDLACTGITQMQDFSNQINMILHNSEVIKIYFRSVKINGVFQDTVADMKLEELEHDDNPPTNHIQYKNKSHVILDIVIDSDGQTWNFYRLPEGIPRTLRLYVK
jgi:hypothetical protein